MAAPDLSRVGQRAARHQLDIFGAFHAGDGDGCAPGTMILLYPHEPGFWKHVQSEPEFRDDAPDPLDRWSARVIGRLASDLGGEAHFPFTGPPYAPFIAWALRTGRAWQSPVGMLVHDRAGLMISLRGAILLPEWLNLPRPPRQSPCTSCTKPCLSACPVGALGTEPYDVPACHDFLDSPGGADCLSQGCRVRRACPISQGLQRDPAQSAHHMRHFHP